MKAATLIPPFVPTLARRAWLGAAAVALLAGAALPARAQDAAASYPNKMIRIVVPNPAGGTSDVLGRMLAKELGEMFKQPVIVENKAGGNGHIGASFVAKAAPDGYNLLLLDMSVLTIGPSVVPQLSYNPKELTPIAIPAYSPHLLVVRNDLPVKNIDELAAYAKKSGKPPSFGTPLASISQLAGILLAQNRGFEFNVIGYKGGAQALADLAGGQIDSAMASVVATNALVQGGKVKAIAVTSAKPFAATPGVPTVAAQIPDFVTGSWQGLLAPANTPPAVLDKLQDAIKRIVAKPEVAKHLQELGSEPSPMNRQQLAEWMRTETQRWGKVVKDNNIKAE
ncbi:tripartite tricarboxylate transporter substrate binding protein [Variovorax sp. KK3]|uniref:Bug family tripartite tricarboxylate transporter substrate binding protein n=1 Tax=Variovorax sp. KK3 TaxID=1855728 RepID=UPI00097BE303|nr:tripartite tricarboxylate transporter substrate binding protein [Variovorax sp. KK3]